MSTTTESKREIPDPSSEELGLINMMRDGIMPAYLDKAGYDVTKTQTKWEDSTQAKSFTERRASLTSQLSTAMAGGGGFAPPIAGMTVGPYARGAGGGQSAMIQSQLNALDQEEAAARAAFTPSTDYITREKADAYTEDIRARYGEDSPEYKQATSEYTAKKVERERQTERITTLAMDKAEKFLKGDYSLTPEQEKWLGDTLGPIKEAGINAIKYIREEAKTTEQGMLSAIDAFASQVKDTGMKMGDAITEIESRVKTTGANMKTALEESIAQTKAQVEMGIQDFSLATRRRLAEQAASLGRSVTDPGFIQEMQTTVNREIQRTGYAFGEMAARGRMGVEERTGAGLEEAGRLRASVAERTGTGLEEAARLRLGVAERTGGLMEEAARRRGEFELGFATNEANLRKDLGMTQVPGAIGLGFDVDRYQQAVQQTKLANAAAAMNAPLPLISWYQSERMAEPTTTTRTSMGAGGIIGGIVGMGLQGAAAGASGAFGPTVAGWFGNKPAGQG